MRRTEKENRKSQEGEKILRNLEYLNQSSSFGKVLVNTTIGCTTCTCLLLNGNIKLHKDCNGPHAIIW